MKNFYIHSFLKSGYFNSFIISLTSNYKNKIWEIDYICLYYLKKIRCKSSTINYSNYKFSSCLSIENIICHGIPILKNYFYNFIKVDLSIKYKKLHSDSCYNSNYYKKKNYFFKLFFYNIIKKIKNSYYSFFKKIVINNNFKNVYINEDFCSHGIFRKLHNKLIIYHNNNNNNEKFQNFDSFTIEPMFLFKSKKGYFYKNVFFSLKHNISFQWEHTLYYMNKKIIITTLRKNEL